MNAEALDTERLVIEGIVRKLETAWNAGDGEAFAAPFAADADFVTIRAERYSGRGAIASGHTAILRTIYAGSTNEYAIEACRFVRPDVALVHVRSQLDAPTGPLAGRHAALFSAIVTRESGGWRIAAFHNTLAPPARSARGTADG